MSRIYEIQQDFVGVISTLRRAFSDCNNRPLDALPREVWTLFYPMRYQEIVSTYAARNGLDPNLVLGVIRQESAFIEAARSRSNARGLMQVIPSTGRMLARQSGLRGYSHRKLFQAGTNIALGTRHFSSLLQKFDGKLELALAGYNAGDQRALRWRLAYGDADLAALVELIPFAETRQYVRLVLTNSAHYRDLLGKGDPPSGPTP